MKSNILYSYIIITTCLTTFWMVEGHRRCYTPINKKGDCIDVEECGPVSAILHNKRRNRTDSTYLRDSTCGFDNMKLKVCCETPPERKGNCTSPDQQPGLCINIFECPSLSVAFNTNRKLIEQSACGGSPLNVCCKDDVLFPSISPKQILPGRTECGFQEGIRKLQDISNGKARIYDYPWTALLEYHDHRMNELRIVCAATLINSKYVLSTAHCFANTRIEIRNVILGEYNMNTIYDCQNIADKQICIDEELRVPVEKVVQHPYYASGKFSYDISLVKMSKTVQYTNFIKPICLPQMNIEEDVLNPVQQLLITGWYLVYENHPQHTAEAKLHIKVPLVPLPECKSIYKNNKHDIINDHICVGGIVNISTCGGDAGAPLMRLRNGQFEILGISSFGPSTCGSGKTPEVFTNVFLFMDWIIENIE